MTASEILLLVDALDQEEAPCWETLSAATGRSISDCRIMCHKYMTRLLTTKASTVEWTHEEDCQLEQALALLLPTLDINSADESTWETLNVVLPQRSKRAIQARVAELKAVLSNA